MYEEGAIAIRGTMGRSIRVTGLAAGRWLLFVMLVLGVCGMHTLGHVAMGEMSGDRAMESHQAAAALPSYASRVLNDEMPGLDPRSVCLAVLTSLLTIALIASAALARWTPEAESSRPSWVARTARPPPSPTSIQLAHLSVLRI
ncbi:DUF6153 family protein [Nonomuraea sp. NPDC049129]|uniref:DUF6153 family protein n=1 Tax=Nonomuraea sp. NPDC049129 TaxID=3155272 RepID=UPI0033FA6D22